MICPRCGFSNHESAKFCEKCGMDLTSPPMDGSQEETVAFRENVGRQTDGRNDQTEFYSQGDAGWKDGKVDWGSPQEEDGYRYNGYSENRCSNCGSLLDEGCKFCPVCGAPAEQNPGPGKRKGNRSFQGSGKEKKDKSLAKQILLVLLILFLLIDAILAGYYFYTRNSDTDTADQEEVSAESDAQAESDDEQTEEVSEATPVPTKEPEIVHTYEYYIDNCSWEEAYQKCREQNGYLVRIESAEEFETICREIRAKGMQDYMFFIGARRDPGTSSYYWIDENNVITGEPINDVNSPLNSYWMANEPSFTDGAIEETCMEMNFYSGENRWVINDVPNELTDVVPEFTGKIGYICEYEITR